MAKILVKNNLAPAVYEFIIEAPMIAHKCQPGQFVMIRTDENSERIPLTIADFDREKGTITLIVQTVGNTTTHLCETFIVGDEILDVLGPLGMPSHMGKFGTVVCVGGGIGVAPVYPIARAYHKLGNKVISIIGARNKDLIIFKEKMEAVSDDLIITTDVVDAAVFADSVPAGVIAEADHFCLAGSIGTGHLFQLAAVLPTVAPCAVVDQGLTVVTVTGGIGGNGTD